MTKKGSKYLFNNADKKNNFNVEYQYIDTDKNQPLFIIDGRMIKEGEFRDIDPNNIESIEVIKDKKATKAYGVRGKNGVVIVNSKSFKKNSAILVEVEEDSPWAVKLQ